MLLVFNASIDTLYFYAYQDYSYTGRYSQQRKSFQHLFYKTLPDFAAINHFTIFTDVVIGCHNLLRH